MQRCRSLRIQAFQTCSPYIWASSSSEVVPSPATVKHACNFFREHGPQTRFLPPKDLGYDLPTDSVPEIAFAGRSNVGKSTLLSTLIGQSKLVRVSKTPGCTETLNFFSIGGEPHGRQGGKKHARASALLVDLPGYGFAKVSKDQQAQWSRVMNDYLLQRGFPTLRRVLILIDVRRGPSPVDWSLMELLSTQKVPFQIVLTKADAIRVESEKIARVAQIFEELASWKSDPTPTNMPLIHVVSSKTNKGIDELRATLLELMDHKR